jgi:hypothetical protein
MSKAIFVLIVAAQVAATNQLLQSQAQRHSNTATQESARDTHPAQATIAASPAPKIQQESAEEEAKRQDESDTNWWMVRLTAVLAFIGALQTLVFGWQARRLKQTIDKMDEVAEGQTRDMEASIGQATRAAAAMEGVATAMAGVANSMAINVEQLKITVGTNREIADRQKLISELQSRAYMVSAFLGVVPQDAIPDYRFEVRTQILNFGNTPAYHVRHAVAADVLPFPLPLQFTFPLPEMGESESVIGPHQNRIVSGIAAKRYPPIEVDQILKGFGQRLYMWGRVVYEDAFKIERFTEFSFSVVLLSNGNFMSYDTNRHNNSN